MDPVFPFRPHRSFSLAAAMLLAFSSSPGCDRSVDFTVEEHIQRAKDMNAEGKLKGVVIELKNAIQKSPDNPQARLMLGEAYLKFKLSDHAVKELERARTLGVSEATIKPLLGEAWIISKEYQRVLDELQITYDANPRDRARILQQRGDALLGLKRGAEGCALYRESNKVDPQWHQALTGIAGCDFAHGKISEARLTLQQALKFNPASVDAWIMLSKLERSQKQFPAARAALNSALKANSASLDALLEHVSLSVEMNDMKTARHNADLMRSMYPKHFMSDYAQALVAFNEKKLDAAREFVTNSLRTTPGYVPAILLAGAVEFGLGNMQTAETYLTRAVKNWPRHSYALRLLAATHLKQGKADKAAATLAALDPAHTNDIATLLIAGEVALVQKQYAASSQYLEKAAALNPNHAKIRAQLGVSRMGEGDPRALTDLIAASGLDQEWKGADKSLILEQIRQRNYDGALASIATLEKKAPNSPEPWNYRGVVYLSQQNFAKARESFEQALKLKPGHLPSAINLAELDLHDKQPAAAKKRFESVLAVDKSNLDAILGLAALAARDRNPRELQARLEQANKAAPGALKPLILLSRLYLGRGDPSKALIYARQAHDAHPNHPDALGVLGNIQLVTNDLTSALSTYKRLVDIAPQSVEAHIQLAHVQLASKQNASARTSLIKAKALEPDNVPAQDALLQLEISERNYSVALQIARSLQLQQPKSALGFEREGDIWFAQKQLARATGSYTQGLNRGESSAGIIKLLRTLQLLGDTHRADEMVAAWVSKHPKDSRVRAYAAEYYLVTGRNRNAIVQYEYLLQSAPNQVSFLNNLAMLYQREKDARAQATAARALKLAPDSPGIQDTLGWILLEKGEVVSALSWLKKATSTAPQAKTIRYHYAVALARNGNTSQAKKELKALLDSKQPDFPESASARKLLATL